MIIQYVVEARLFASLTWTPLPDFAAQMKWLVDEAYPEAEVIRVVLAKLNTPIRTPRAPRPSPRLRLSESPKIWSFTSQALLPFQGLSRNAPTGSKV